ncbi:MAG: archaeal proteasome endopeptidase complex subunit alpha [Thermoproteota archaeon]
MIPGYERLYGFSPDGRILQVDYAMVMVNNSPTAWGIQVEEGIVLAGLEKRIDMLQDRTFSQKLFQIDEHIATVVAGFNSDARLLVEYARNEAQINRLLYDEPIDVEFLVRRLSNTVQSYTQHAGMRPFGISMLIGGVDMVGASLYQLDPTGIYFKYFASAIGVGREDILKYFRDNYSISASLDEAITLGIRGSVEVLKDEVAPDRLRIGVIRTDDKKFRVLSFEETKKYYERAK